jgi:DNA-binding NarL/FixJ family response regulator
MSAEKDLSRSNGSGTSPVHDGSRNGAGGVAVNSKAMSVVVSHPEDLFRDGLVRFLNQQPDIDVLAHCDNNSEALNHCQARSPGILLCDGECLRLPVEQLTRRLKSSGLETRVLVIGLEAQDPETVLRWGAWGLISRSSSGELFSRAVRIIASGQYWVGRELLTQLARKALYPEEPPRKVKRVLSTREAEILRLVSAGKTNDQIAEALFIEVNTVRTHLRRIYQKLNVHDRTSAVVTASRNGYIELSRS